MKRFIGTVVLLGLAALATPASAHPAPFSYIDVLLGERAVEVTVVAHVYDLAHDLGLPSTDPLLDKSALPAHARDILTLLAPRFRIEADGQALACRAESGVELLPERQSVKSRFACGATGAGALTVRALMFPYDTNHQTFLNVYEGGTLRTQAILDAGHTSVEYFRGTRQGVLAVVRRFVPAGIHHILIGPDHLLFLIGLLLLGGTIRQLLVVVSSFTLAHSITLSLAALNLVTPPARLIEPAIALSIVYVGFDNLLVRGGRDVRAWIALSFGLIHGFGFASVLREMDLPARALGWSLFSFNVGVEIGQLFVVVIVASALEALRRRSEWAGRRLALAGSLGVIVAGAFWFVQRVFFPGGI
ncbi:MAG: HupE/UreJ family protein [Betaproteobacteria bacterium]